MKKSLLRVCAMLVAALLFTACTQKKNGALPTGKVESQTPDQSLEDEYNKEVQNMDGKPIPEIMLERPDGSKVSIKSLQGKYTYIDVWATWCGPCCKEIPFLEKLVEDMKDNTKLQFVSLSMDSDREAWMAKLEKDKPAWAQFILDAEASMILSEALAITGIPRFFVLGPDGTVLNQDTQRPSNPELVEYLNELTK